MGLRVKGFKANPEGLRQLATRLETANAFQNRAEQIRQGTIDRATLSGYKKTVDVEVEVRPTGVVAIVYSTWPFAHLDEWGGLMYATPSYPMTRTIQSLGLKFTPTGKGEKGGSR